METGSCNTPLLLIGLLMSPAKGHDISFYQVIGETKIHWTREELLKKPLIDLLVMDKNMFYIIKEKK